jgi:Na+-transporting NADH:ubiquinone oxidoreductase subunit NqrD
MAVNSQNNPLWGINSPLSALAGAALFIIASARLESALICLFALLWINTLTMLALAAGRPAVPEKGSAAVRVFTASFAGLLFFFLLWFFNPLSAMESAFFLVLCPALFINSGIYERAGNGELLKKLLQAASEALAQGLLVVAVALIREPLGSGALSLPGLEPFRFALRRPAAVFGIPAGALLLLGYGIALYRRLRNHFFKQEGE